MEKNVPRKLQAMVGELCFFVNLWWKIPLWVAPVAPYIERQDEMKKKSNDTHEASHVGIARSNIAEKMLFHGKTRIVDEATPLVLFVGRL